MKKYLVILFFLSITHAALCQIQFQKEFTGTQYQYGYHAIQTFDGGYLLSGYTYSFGAGGSDIYLIKTNLYGDTIWTKTYGNSGDERGFRILQLRDSSIVLATYLDDTLLNQACFLKLDQGGNIIWGKTYQVSGSYYSTGDVAQTDDRGFILLGGYSFDYSLLRIDSVGNIVWAKKYRKSVSQSSAYQVILTTDGGFLMVGTTYDPNLNTNYRDILVVRTDSSGNLEWAKCYASTYADIGTSVQQTFDGGFIIAGHSDSNSVGKMDALLIKINDIGDTVWTRTYGGNELDYGMYVIQTADSGLVMIGESGTFGTQCYMVKTNFNGDTIWTKSFGGYSSLGRSIELANDSGFIISGIKNGNMYLAKTNSLGEPGCSSISTATDVTFPLIVVTSPAITVTNLSMTSSTPLGISSQNGIPITDCIVCDISDAVNIIGADSLCFGDSALITIDTSMASYVWNTGDTTQAITVYSGGVYYATVTDNNGCTTTTPVHQISILQSPVVNFIGLPDTACSDWNQITLVGNPVGGIYNGSGMSDSIFNPAGASLGLNEITYSFTDSLGCSNSFTDSVFVDLCLGLDNVKVHSLFLINPCSTYTKIFLPEILKDATIVICNETGGVLFTQAATELQMQINTEKFPAGIYNVKVFNNRFSKTLRLVKISMD